MGAFTITTTKEKARSLIEPIFHRIYGLPENDIKLIKRWLDSDRGDLYFDHSYQSKSDLVIRRLFNELCSSMVQRTINDNDEWELKFTIDSKVTIVGVLPNSHPKPRTSSAFASYRIINTVNELLDRLSEIDRTLSGQEKVRIFPRFTLSANELNLSLIELLMESVISKLFKIDDNLYLCVYHNTPLYCDISDGYLNVEIVEDLIFDIDDGFIGKRDNVLNKLSPYFTRWKEEGDMTRPVIGDILV